MDPRPSIPERGAPSAGAPPTTGTTGTTGTSGRGLRPLGLRSPRSAGYVPLWVKSHYSFLEGTSSPEELATQAHALGLGAMAMTDRDGVYGLVKAHFAARERGLRLICGAELTITHGDPRRTSPGAQTRSAKLDSRTRVVALVHDQEGYAQLCQLISMGQARARNVQS